ncbi:rhodanese-like domain-containing protein [Jatrophihabitans telluris]|uniref:Rhodanese-like domain-containing protein n=1 Tax=Jatrophihabitans telluris TaxID=2038343 RepID=A0ABY4QTC6_9ACTN|nr:rhodanese-like domain-containing protein [Jatrophihabitans telluris]UQX86930.1 rhodanese-like domain-containing protein [Jatrophihabitans telluris]
MSGAEIDLRLDEARQGWCRLSPVEAVHAQAGGALLIDTRTEWQRLFQGELPGAIVIDRTVLEWRLDPGCSSRIPEAIEGMRVVVVCRQGFSSSLAVASLRSLGIDASDVVGGAEAWIDAGLPVHAGSADVRR